MRSPIAWLAGFLVVAVIAITTWSLTRGQAPAGGPTPPRTPASANSDTPPTPKAPTASPKLSGPTDAATLDSSPDAVSAPDQSATSRDPAAVNSLQNQIQLTAHRGAD